MKIYSLNHEAEIEHLLTASHRFADAVNSPLPAHRLGFLFSWWRRYASKNGEDFGKNRGRNFLGSKSWLEGLYFVIAETDKTLLGIAPLFISRVIVKGLPEPVRLLSFCPDSSLLFYQDLLVHPDHRAPVIEGMFQFIADFIQAENLILFLGHIPDSSPNIPFIQHEMNRYMEKGWKAGEAVNCWRGGVFPWNIDKLCNALRTLREKAVTEQDPLFAEISECISALRGQTSALLLFANTRKQLEARVRSIVARFDLEPNLAPLVNLVAEIFDTKAIRYPILRLPADTAEFYGRLSASKRYFYRRYFKQFISAGGGFENVAPEEIRGEDIDAYIGLHMARWQEGSAAFHHKTISFQKQVSQMMADAGYFRLFFATHNRRRIAALSCFDICGTREFYYSGRTMEDTHLRAGKLLVLHSILDAINKGFSYFDFGFGGDGYKFDFTNDYKTLKSFFLSKTMELSFLDRLFPLYENITMDL